MGPIENKVQHPQAPVYQETPKLPLGSFFHLWRVLFREHMYVFNSHAKG